MQYFCADNKYVLAFLYMQLIQVCETDTTLQPNSNYLFSTPKVKAKNINMLPHDQPALLVY